MKRSYIDRNRQVEAWNWFARKYSYLSNRDGGDEDGDADRRYVYGPEYYIPLGPSCSILWQDPGDRLKCSCGSSHIWFMEDRP